MQAEKIVERNIPVMFQKLSEYQVEDTRFMKVKIWLMHIGENLNGSYFSKSVVENAISSLANTPILAYIEVNSDDEMDFSDHRMKLVVEDGEYKIRYMGQAIGVIPETNNAQFENRICDDGVEREYLTVEGLCWTKWDTPVDILNRDSSKSQSMEIHSDYSGEFSDDGLFHFKTFKFFGACALGKNVIPAMINSTIEKQQFSFEELHKELQDKMEQFKNYSFQQIQHLSMDDVDEDSNKGGYNMEEKLQLLQSYSLTIEQLQEKDINIEEFSLEDLEVKIKEFTSSEFALTHNQLESEIRKVLNTRKVIIRDYWGDVYEESEYYFRDIKDNVVIVIDNEWDNYYGITFAVNEDVVTLDFDNKVPYIADWRPKIETDANSVFNKQEIESKIKYSVEKASEKAIQEFNITETNEYQLLQGEFTDLQSEFTKLKENQVDLSQYESLKNELDSLKSYKITKEREEKEELFEQFAEKLTDEEIQPLKESMDNYTHDDLEIKLYAVLGKKAAQFSKTKKTKVIDDQSTNGILFDRQDQEEKKSGKPYADLVEKYSKNKK